MTNARVELETVDVDDEAVLRQWWEVGAAASAERPYDAWPAWEVARRGLPRPSPATETTLVVAREGEEVVGSGMIQLHRHDNLHLADLSAFVHPEQRRRGIGSALLGGLEQRARSRGRTTAVSAAFAPPAAESASTLFAAARGYAVASHEETKLLDLAEAKSGWDALEAEVVAAGSAYRIMVFEDRCPPEHVEGMCEVLSVFLGEIPTGDLDLEDAVWTPERLRAGEQRAVDMGRTSIVALALAPDGSVCGFTDLRIHPEQADLGSVGGTLVLPGHRGHRLGLGLKLATHRRLLELFPGCRQVETGNAGVNGPMNAVNERMGYRVVERALDVHKPLDT